ncbi:hypothetical protein V1264_021101 [Littorina saxatilis]|uniref:Uncharacterized protein n=1 Tax=Littorina saxatilis TaxID=31220 RepID=A0AAN9BD97_9CAEN
MGDTLSCASGTASDGSKYTKPDISRPLLKKSRDDLPPPPPPPSSPLHPPPRPPPNVPPVELKKEEDDDAVPSLPDKVPLIGKVNGVTHEKSTSCPDVKRATWSIGSTVSEAPLSSPAPSGAPSTASASAAYLLNASQ